MIETIPNVPENVAAFSATGEVSADDFKSLILPTCERKVEQYGELNYLLQLQEDVPNFTAGAWAQDMFLGLKHITKWNRCAIVTDKETIHTITNVFSKLVPGEFKGFDQDELQQAIAWCSTGNQ